MSSIQSREKFPRVQYEERETLSRGPSVRLLLALSASPRSIESAISAVLTYLAGDCQACFQSSWPPTEGDYRDVTLDGGEGWAGWECGET